MAETFTVREVTPADSPKVVALHRAHYWRSHCLLLDAPFYQWQFADYSGRDQSIVAVDHDGTLLSFLGVVPAVAQAPGAPAIHGAHLISWLSAPVAGGRGVGQALMRFVIERYQLLFGRSVTPAALAIYRKLGFRYFPSCRRWLAILDVPGALKLAIDATQETERRLAARHVASMQAPYLDGPELPIGIDPLARRSLADATAFIRDARYLQWRYVNHPSLRYHFVYLGLADRPAAFAVVRVEDVRERPGERVLRILELLSPPTQARALAEAVFAYGRNVGCAYADFFGISDRFSLGLVAAGAFEMVEEPDVRLPHLLQPWDSDHTPPGLLFYARRPADGASFVDALDGFYCTKGDGNMDWPSWVPT